MTIFYISHVKTCVFKGTYNKYCRQQKTKKDTDVGIRDYTKMEKHTKVVFEKEKTINFEELNDYIKWLIKDSILSARKNRDCTQEALAEEINVSAKTMQAYELYGKTGRIPKTTQFLYMAAVIDINLNELRDEIKGKIKELSTHCR